MGSWADKAAYKNSAVMATLAGKQTSCKSKSAAKLGHTGRHGRLAPITFAKTDTPTLIRHFGRRGCLQKHGNYGSAGSQQTLCNRKSAAKLGLTGRHGRLAHVTFAKTDTHTLIRQLGRQGCLKKGETREKNACNTNNHP